MHAILKRLNQINTNQLIYIISLVAGMFTWRVMDIRNDWVNVDSILYLDSASAMLKGNWQEAYQTFKWPFYSGMIAFVSKLSGLAVFSTAKILNIVFFSITSFSLLKIVEKIQPDRLTLAFFTLLILGSRYIGGSILPMLLRDEGFWACLATATLLLIKFLENRELRHALMWQVFIILAMLFRIEGAVYLVALPLVIFWQEPNKKIATLDYLKLNCIVITLLVCALASLPFFTISTENIGRLNELQPQSFFGSVSHLFVERSEAMRPILGKLLEEYHQISLSISLLTITLIKMLEIISIPTLLIFTIYKSNHLRFQHKLLPNHVRFPLWGIFWVVTLTSLASILRSFVLSGRYLMPLAFISAVLASVMLTYMMKKRSLIKPRHQIVLVIILVIFSLQFIKNIWPKPANYNYVKNSVDYLQKLRITTDNVTIFSRKAGFYAQKKEVDIYTDCSSRREWECVTNYIKKNPRLDRFILIPIDVGRDTEKVDTFLNEQLTHYRKIQEFSNPKKDKKMMLLERVD